MTLAYSTDALCFDADTDSYTLRADFDPVRHRVEIECGGLLGWSGDSDAGWNDPDDPPIAQVRDMLGVPTHAGHTYAADRFRLVCPDGTVALVDMLEIDHQPVGVVVDRQLVPGVLYPLARNGQLYRAPDKVPLAKGFGPGTMISTQEGDMPVEWLAPGDAVHTIDNGPQTLRWVGHTRLSARRLARDPGLLPVQLTPDMASMVGLDHDLCLAPQTQVVLSGPEIALNFGIDRSLARVADLMEQTRLGVYPSGLTYFLLLFDKHQVVRANGLWCESLFADARDWSGILQQYPGAPKYIRHDAYAMSCLSDWETRLVRTLHPQVQIMRRIAAA